jgi:hypothetical protein
LVADPHQSQDLGAVEAQSGDEEGRGALTSGLGSSDFGIFLEIQYASFVLCFWFGLEILRLVYKQAFCNILNDFYLICPFILRKSIIPPYTSYTNFYKIVRKGYQKKRNFALI